MTIDAGLLRVSIIFGLILLISGCSGVGLSTSPPADLTEAAPSALESLPSNDISAENSKSSHGPLLEQTSSSQSTSQHTPLLQQSTTPPSRLSTLTRQQTIPSREQRLRQETALLANGQTAPVLQPGTAPGQQQRQPLISSAKLSFEPMIGAPTDVARELSGKLGLSVAQRGLPVVARNSQGITHHIKGYLSASQSGDSTTIDYVWDIFTPNGQRVERISGSARAPRGTGLWQTVSGAVLKRIADDTSDKLAEWLQRS